MDVVIIVIYSSFILLTVVLCICFTIGALKPNKNQQATGTGTYITEEDFWDEIDGGTYVTMSDGSVRLDNNGKK